MKQILESEKPAFNTIRPETIRWETFAAFPAGAKLAVLIGHPDRAGPYVIRVHLPAGVRMMPHRHPEDRIYTVISGVFYIGLGEEFDEGALQAFGVGSVILLPAGQAHYHWAKSGDYVTQVNATGPLGLTYARDADDPRAISAPQVLGQCPIWPTIANKATQ